MENTTKLRILEEALVMFANNGYKGTNLRDLAAQIGVSKSALYKHFESKEAIWNALFDQMEEYYTQRFGSAEHMPPMPTSLEELLSLTVHLADFTIHDQQVILTRRILLTEQFRNDRARKQATAHFLTGTQKIFTDIFTAMMENHLLKKDDPAMLAFAYTTPITTLIHLCDREPDRAPEVMAQIESFVRHFIATYREEEISCDKK